MMSNNKNELSFIVVGDIHRDLKNTSSTSIVGVDDRKGPATQPTCFEDRFELLKDELSQYKELDFILFNGDFIHSNIKNDSRKISLTHEIIQEIQSVLPNTKVYFSEGNHDNFNETSWFDATAHSKNHSFEIDDYGFVIIRSSNTTGDRQVLSDAKFIESTFDTFEDKKGIFVFSHIPRFNGIRENEPFFDSPEDTETLNLFNQQDNLKAVFVSHFHEYDNLHVVDGVNHFFTGYIAHYGLNYYGFKKVDIKNDLIKVEQVDMTNKKVKYTDYI